MTYKDIIIIFNDIYDIKISKRTLGKYSSLGLLPEPLTIKNNTKIFNSEIIGAIYSAWKLFKCHMTINEVSKARKKALQYIAEQKENNREIPIEKITEDYLLNMLKINLGYLPNDRVLVTKINNVFKFSLEYARII